MFRLLQVYNKFVYSKITVRLEKINDANVASRKISKEKRLKKKARRHHKRLLNRNYMRILIGALKVSSGINKYGLFLPEQFKPNDGQRFNKYVLIPLRSFRINYHKHFEVTVSNNWKYVDLTLSDYILSFNIKNKK